MKKILIAAVVLILLVPILPKLLQLMPQSLTMDRIEPGLKAAGFDVTNAQKVAPNLGAIDELSMTVNGASVEVYQFDDQGKIALQMEYQKPDAGSAIVEQWNLAESLGAAKSKNKPCLPVRRGMFMAVITSDSKELNNRIGKAFSSL